MVFLEILALVAGMAIAAYGIKYLGSWGFFLLIVLGFIIYLIWSKKNSKKESAEPAPVKKIVTLDYDEIRKLGLEAAHWCRTWMNDSTANHKWLVIEIGGDKMDCRSLRSSPPYKGYPHCTIKYSQTISAESRSETAQELLSIIRYECPEIIRIYGLYRDGSCLILPTNYE